MSEQNDRQHAPGPLNSLDDWEDDLRRRYPEPANAGGDDRTNSATGSRDDGQQRLPKQHRFRDYGENTKPHVREFYRLNHRHQTLEFGKQKRSEYLPPRKTEMSVWQAMEFLNTLIDDSDPDTDLPQIEHLIQTAEAIRADGHPRWFVLAGLIHDLGKVLCLFGEPQWAVVGDTFPVGCAFSDKVVLSGYFDANLDAQNHAYQTRLGIYDEGGGLDRVLMSWGHDEYLYHVVKDHLPDEALYMIRYHSFYAAHRDREYDYLMNDRDRDMFRWVRKFNPYDLYTKTDQRPNMVELEPFYRDLIDEYFPARLQW